jgi:hypothetical protein
MTPPQGSSPRPPRPRSASPAERSVEFAEAQRKLKEEAAQRRLQASQRSGDAHPPKSTDGKSRGRG